MNKDDNRDKDRERVKEYSKTDRTYALRMVRELNNGVVDYKKLNQKL